MSGSVDKSSKSFPSVQVIVLAEIAWAVMALLLFLLFSVPRPGEERALWYSYATSMFEIVAFLVASILCFRNWRSPQIVSGRSVWLGIGLGMFFYFIGGLLFTYWETVLGRDAAVSPGDFFYLIAYVCIVVGMVQAVVSRRLNLVLWQWLVVAGIAVGGVAIAVWLSVAPATASQIPQSVPVVAQASPTASPKPAPKATKPPAPKASPTPAAKKAKPSPVASPQGAEIQPAGTPAAAAQEPPPPGWVTVVEGILEPMEAWVLLFYVVADVVLLIIATTLLLAFWGGRFALSWRLIAAAAFSFYIADMWFKYANSQIRGYQSGSLPEVFWVFSGVLFGIGAALEYDLSSSRSRRSGGRRSRA